jgi:fructose-bisphosphate aldolase class I
MVAAMMTSQQALSGSKVFAAPRAQTSSRRGIVAVRAGKYDEELVATAAHMTAPGKGLLAIDESNATAGKRLDSIGGERTLSYQPPSILFGAAEPPVVPGPVCMHC